MYEYQKLGEKARVTSLFGYEKDSIKVIADYI